MSSRPAPAAEISPHARALTEAGSLIASALEPRAMLAQLAEVAIAYLADMCFIDLAAGPDKLERVAWTHRDPVQRAKQHVLPKLVVAAKGKHPINQAFCQGKTVFVREVTTAWMRSIAYNEEHFRFMASSGMISLIATPMVARGRVLGVMTLTRSHQHFTDRDTELADELARRAGVAIENAQLHRALEEQAEHMRLAVEAADLGTWDYDLVSGEMVLSERCKTMFGFKPLAQVNYDAIVAAIHPDDRARAAQSMQQAMDPAGDGHYDIEYRVVGPGRDERDIASSGRVFFDAGKAIRMAGTVRDVTDAKRAAQALEKSEALFRGTFDQSSVAMTIADLQGRWLRVNDAAGNFFGYPPRELHALHYRDITHPDDRDLVHSDLPRLLRGEVSSVREEKRYIRKDGAIVWGDAHISVVRDRSDQPIYLTAIIQDITARKQAELSLKRSEESARLLAEMSGIFGSSIDYEETLMNVANLLVAHIADWCAVDLVDDEGQLRRVKIAHRDPAKEHFALALQKRYPTDPNAQHGASMVVRTGKPEMLSDIPDALVDAGARDAEHARLLRGLGLRSYICVPLTARGQNIGALTLVTDKDSDRHYDAAALAFAEQIALRAAAAVDNAQLLHRAIRELKRRKAIEQLLETEKERLAVTLHNIADAVVTLDVSGFVVAANRTAEHMLGGDIVGKELGIALQLAGKECSTAELAARLFRTAEPVDLCRNARFALNGQERLIDISGAAVRNKGAENIGAVVVLRDVTERQRQEEELLKTRKLESLGVLAGGIAHDFNNILTAILGNLSLARMYIDKSHPVDEVLAEAERASVRARDLTQQLLTFSRGGAPIKKTSSIAELLRDTSGFVLRGSNISPEYRIAPDLWAGRFDPGQISQVVNNLLINAKQAMPRGGKVIVSAENARLQEANPFGLPPGNYVAIAVQDFGVGIPTEHVDRIFDPYFTTKQTGSGLGLATAYSIVTKHEGFIGVESSPGDGARFTVVLPAIEGGSAAPDVQKTIARGRHQRVLLMDDEAAIRHIGAALLRQLGYEVEVAADGAEALRLYREATTGGRAFKAVIMDLTVPGGMGGQECLAALRALDPSVVALVSSGYSNDPIMANHAEYGFAGIVTKPYQLSELASALDSVIQPSAA